MTDPTADEAPPASAQVQLRGHCQNCGRVQAVVQGRVAKHGYRVRDGYFQGQCDGHAFAPLEHDDRRATWVVEAVRAAARKHEAQAADFDAGRAKPPHAGRWSPAREVLERVPIDQATPEELKLAGARAASVERDRARCARAYADQLAELIGQVHGRPLAEVERAAARSPARIRVGEQRVGGDGRLLRAVSTPFGGLLDVEQPDGARQSMTTRAWRVLALASQGHGAQQ